MVKLLSLFCERRALLDKAKLRVAKERLPDKTGLHVMNVRLVALASPLGNIALWGVVGMRIHSKVTGVPYRPAGEADYTASGEMAGGVGSQLNENVCVLLPIEDRVFLADKALERAMAGAEEGTLGKRMLSVRMLAQNTVGKQSKYS